MKPEKFVKELGVIFRKNANPENAAAMSKYMKNLFPYYGIKKPLRIEITKSLLLKAKEDLNEKWILETANLLWKKKEREFHYIALDLFGLGKNLLTPKSFKPIEKLLITNSWWDSVDTLTTNAIARLVLNYPELKGEMKRYVTHENLWLRRVSIIHQLPYREKTDQQFLFEACKKNMSDSNFFIRKAIGWSLRQYAKYNPKDVYRFVEANKHKLSNLSIREALKHK